jgi:hypothetical protein
MVIFRSRVATSEPLYAHELNNATTEIIKIVDQMERMLQELLGDKLLQKKAQPCAQAQETHDFGAGPVPAHKHPNGGGWVAETARVSETAYVGSKAEVYGDAVVSGNERRSC